ncbi:ejaculatory bulb-specific protein 3-like [Vanessa cardui]|uniref:ejaculatory bulb-specific protein 3-like n=1 Tax=Vanessa cardui TaxID=171605 RepID=UPI001F145A7D|nr:ejaculatory bulb-specific protein 3-like [Vanessa cardui]
MKLILVLAIVAVVAARPEDDLSRYDNFDIDEVINNKRLLKAYMDCFIETGKCTPEGNDFKKWIPQSMEDSCSKCSEKQKILVAKVILAIKEEYNDGWLKLNELYNPGGKYDTSLNAFIEKYGH